VKCLTKNKKCKLVSNYQDKDKSFMCVGLCKPTKKKFDVIKLCIQSAHFPDRKIEAEFAPDEALDIIQLLSFGVEKFLIKDRAYKKFREGFK